MFCYHGAIIKLEVKIEAKKYVWDRKLNLLELAMKYDRFVVLVRHDSAEIWGLGMDSHLALVI
jgi:hypothetical protein